MFYITQRSLAVFNGSNSSNLINFQNELSQKIQKSPNQMSKFGLYLISHYTLKRLFPLAMPFLFFPLWPCLFYRHQGLPLKNRCMMTQGKRGDALTYNLLYSTPITLTHAHTHTQKSFTEQ